MEEEVAWWSGLSGNIEYEGKGKLIIAFPTFNFFFSL